MGFAPVSGRSLRLCPKRGILEVPTARFLLLEKVRYNAVLSQEEIPKSEDLAHKLVLSDLVNGTTMASLII